MAKRRRSLPPAWDTLPGELVQLIGKAFCSSVPMRGVCVAWNAALSKMPRPTLHELLLPDVAMLTSFYLRTRPRQLDLETIGAMSRDEVEQLYRERVQHKTLLGEICVLTGLTPARIYELNPRVLSNTRRSYTLFDTSDAMRRALRNAGGVWCLLARRHAQQRGLRVRRVQIERSAEHMRAIARLAEFLQTQPFSAEQRQNMCGVARRIM